MKSLIIWLILFFIFMPLFAEDMSLKEAMFYQKLEKDIVQCQLCPRRCIIPEGKRGFCQIRENQKGKLYSLVYGRPCSIDIGPIEKAPFYHFLPGHRRLCIATIGCNLKCRYCQNWYISQASPGDVREYDFSPEEIVEEAIKNNVTSISFTYTEPTVYYEYMYEISKLARAKGIKTSVVSNGYINPEPLKKLLKVIDAIKIDFKGFTKEFYQRDTYGELEPVLNTLKILKEENVYFEIVNLIVPTLNDNLDDIRKMCLWIKENLGIDIPLHFNRFSPAYKLTHLPSTPIKTLEEAYRIAKEVGLKYVYIGNVPGHEANSTYCPECKKRLIRRIHFSVLENNVVGGKCKFCGYEIFGIWD